MGTKERYPAEVTALLEGEDFTEGAGSARDERYEMRLTKGELRALQVRAAMYGLRPSQYVRALCCRDPREGVDPMLSSSDWKLAGDYVAYRMEANRLRSEVFRLRQELGRVGNNVNQIARRGNAGMAPGGTDVKAIADGFSRLGDQMSGLEGRCDRLLVSYEGLSKFSEV